MAIITWEDTLACLDVERLEEGRYTAPHIPMPYRRVFGGQLLAQLVAVAEASSESKQVKSLHVVFPREGDLDERVLFDVDALHDGRSFASRALRVHQEGRVIAQATVSLHAPEASALSHQMSAPPPAGPEAAEPLDLGMIPWETRVVDGVDLEARDEGPAESAYFMKTPKLEAGHVAHRALLAHATDLTLIGTSLRPHAGFSEADAPERVITAVTHTHRVVPPCGAHRRLVGVGPGQPDHGRRQGLRSRRGLRRCRWARRILRAGEPGSAGRVVTCAGGVRTPTLASIRAKPLAWRVSPSIFPTTSTRS